jgi:hypothetical protein
MKILGLLAGSIALAGAMLVAQTALAADETLPHTGRVVITAQGDITIPAGEHADAVIVFNGNATIRGEVNAVAVFDGDVVLEGARVESVVVTTGRATIDAASTVLDDVRTIDATVEAAPGSVRGEIRGLEPDLALAAVSLAPVIGLLYVGMTVALMLGALLLAALASRQVRATTSLIRTDLGPTIGAGFVGLLLPPFLAVALAVTVIGIPTAVALLIVVWPAIAFVGYLVAAIWLGETVLGRTRERPGERPYLAALVGVVLLQVAGIIPLVGPVLAFLGFGAVLLAAWRVFRGGGIERPPIGAPMEAPIPA